MTSKAKQDESLCIRLSEDRLAFVCTVRSAGECVASRRVPLHPAAKDEPRDDEYYGGSRAMD